MTCRTTRLIPGADRGQFISEIETCHFDLSHHFCREVLFVLEDGKEAKGNDNFALQDDNLNNDEEEAEPEAEEESQQESEHETSVRLKASAKSANTPESQVIGLPITPPQKRRPIGCVGTFTRVLKQATECVTTLVFEKQRILFDNLTEEDQLNSTTTFINACASDDQLELVKA